MMEVECLGVSFCWCSQLGWRFCDDGGRSEVEGLELVVKAVVKLF